MTNREKIQYGLTFLVDAAALVCGVLLAWLIFGRWLGLIRAVYTRRDVIEFGLVLAAAFFITFTAASQWLGSMDDVRRGFWGELARVVRFDMVLGMVLALLLLVTKATMLESRYLFLGTLLFDFFFMQLFRAALKQYLSHAEFIRRLTGVLTTADRAPALIARLKTDWTKQLRGVALVDALPGQLGTVLDGVPVTAGYEDFLDWIRRDSLDEIYIDLPYADGAVLAGTLHELESMGLDVRLNLPLLENLRRESAAAPTPLPPLNYALETKNGEPMLTMDTTRRTLADVVLKRLMDIAGAVVGLLISIPVIAVAAVPLLLESPGPLFFKQKRVGLNGRVFNLYKLRSMYPDAEARKEELAAQNEMDGPMFKITDDPRITRVGHIIRRFSIDELPQFWNVLKGDMSLVGTRPPTVDEYELYQSHHKRRLSMKPGITGLWQVSGRNDIQDFEEVVRLDVSYIDNWSIWLDIRILLRTVSAVFSGKGAR